MHIIADFFVRRRSFLGGACIALTLLAVYGLTQLEVDDVPRSFFSSDDEAFEIFGETLENFGADDNDCLILLEGEDLFSTQAIALQWQLDEELEQIPGIEAAIGLTDVLLLDRGLIPRVLLPAADSSLERREQARVEALAHPLVGGSLLSEDARALIVIARLAGLDLSVGTMQPRVEAIQALIDKLTPGSGVRARLTGIPPLRVVIFEGLNREQRIFTIIGSLMGLIVGIIAFRRLAPIIITSAASILAGLWGMGLLGLAGEPVNLLNSGLPMLIMVIALTDAVHLVIDVLAGRSAGLDSVQAGRRAIAHLGLACLLTSITTAVGFGSLAVSRVDVIARFGTIFAIAVAMTFIVVLTVVPLLSSILLRGTEAKTVAVRSPGRVAVHMERILRILLSAPAAVSFGGLLLTLGLAALSLQLHPDSRLIEAAPTGSDAAAALLDCDRLFGGTLEADVLCAWPADQDLDSPEVREVLEAVERAVREKPMTTGLLSPLLLLDLLPGGREGSAKRLRILPQEAVRRVLREDLHQALVRSRVPDEGSRYLAPLFDQLSAELLQLESEHPGFKLTLTGTGYMARRNVTLMVQDFASGLFYAALIIFGVISIAFRSLRMGLISILPNAFPLFVSAAFLAVCGIELQVSSAIAFSVLLGLAVDDTIHLIARYKRERETCDDPTEAMVRAVLGVGRALAITTAILLAGFGVLAFSAIPTTRLFAGVCCIGMIAALVGDLLFLPAMIVAWTEKRRDKL